METEFVVRNRRMRKRIEAPFTAKLRAYKNIDPAEKGGWDMVLLRNVSAGGALFLYDKEVETGTLMDFVLNIPGMEKPVECQAMALRVENTNLTKPFNRVAVCFTDMGEDAVTSIDRIAAVKGK